MGKTNKKQQFLIFLQKNFGVCHCFVKCSLTFYIKFGIIVDYRLGKITILRDFSELNFNKFKVLSLALKRSKLFEFFMTIVLNTHILIICKNLNSKKLELFEIF